MWPLRGEQSFLARARLERFERLGVEHPRAAVGRERGAVARRCSRRLRSRRRPSPTRRSCRSATRSGTPRAICDFTAALNIAPPLPSPMIARESQRSGWASTASAIGRAIASPMMPNVVTRSRSARSSTLRGVEAALAVHDRAVAAEQRDQREPLTAAVHQRSEHERAHRRRSGSALRTISAGASIGLNGLPPRQHT